MLARAFLAITLLSATATQAAERRVDLSSFDTLRVEGPFIVTLTTAASPRAMLSGDAEALRRVDARINGTTLVVRRIKDGGTAPQGATAPVMLTIAAPPLSTITVIGGAQVTAQAMRGTTLSLNINGAGEVRVDRADGQQLNAMLLGPARLTIGGGRVSKARLSASGPAAIKAGGLEAGDLLVALDGAGDIDARARYTATVSNTGLGSVTVEGTPKCRITGTGGGGPVRCGGR